jgi:hypothetical protein
MDLIRKRTGQIVLISLIAVFVASGCASFAGRELPIYTNDQLAAPEKKISASYDVKAFGPRGENAWAWNLDKKIQKVLTGSHIFADLQSGTTSGDYHYSFVLRTEEQPGEPIASLNVSISAFTVGIIPAYSRHIFIITVDVKQGDRVLKTYTYKDHMDSWIQLFLVFLTPFNWPFSVGSSVIDNMIMNFAHDFSSDIKSGVYLAQ